MVRPVKKETSGKSAKKILIWCLPIWFIFFIIFYNYLSIKDNHQKQAVAKIGVALSKDIASQAGLPLLEMDVKFLGRIVKAISKQPGVVYVSIIDHKNKLIAYTDQKQLLTLNKEKWDVLDNVQYWIASNPNQKTIMNFSSDVTFSGTKIGEVFLSLATNQVVSRRLGFALTAILSLIIIISVSAFPQVNQAILNSKRSKKKYHPDTMISLDISDYSEIICPLCGKQNIFSQKEFQGLDLDTQPLLIPTSEEKGPVLLTDITKLDKLTWLKRRIVLQCTRIINKIT